MSELETHQADSHRALHERWPGLDDDDKTEAAVWYYGFKGHGDRISCEVCGVAINHRDGGWKHWWYAHPCLNPVDISRGGDGYNDR